MGELSRLRLPGPVLVLYSRPVADAAPDAADTLAQRDAVMAALADLGLEARAAAFDPALACLAGGPPPAVVVNLVESVAGRDELVHLAPALLELAGRAFTGCGWRALIATGDKLIAKRSMRAAGIATPDWLEAVDLARMDEHSGGSWLVKAVDRHASIGIGPDSLCRDPAAAAETIAKRQARHGGSWFAERYVAGRELHLALLPDLGATDMLPIAETLFERHGPGRPRIVDYAAKWDPSSSAFAHTPRRILHSGEMPDLQAELRALAFRLQRLFALDGPVRIDLRLDDRGVPWVIDVNANPCLAPDAGFMAQAAAAGLGPSEVIARLLATGRARPTERD